MIDPATRHRQALDVARYRIHLHVVGAPPPEPKTWKRLDPEEPPVCEVCGAEGARFPMHTSTGARGVIYRPRKGNWAALCEGCKAKGWRSGRCECGKPLHHRDYASNSRSRTNPNHHGRAMGTKCGECRRAVRIETGLEELSE